VDAVIRPLAETDSLEELTALLHRAYARLAHMGFRFTATHQSVETTAQRCRDGKCFVAEDADGKIIGTITYYPCTKNGGCDWYEKPGVATFGQFAVEPNLQNNGIGNALLDVAEKCAAEENASEIALDTAEGAHHLIDYYKRHGYRHVGYADWQDTNYRSAVLSKYLARELPTNESR
jgi:predicted N-acetyltransferase YhbS